MSKSFIFRFLIMFAAVFGLIFLFVWFYLSVTAPADAAEPPAPPALGEVTFGQGQVRLHRRDGGDHAIAVEIAATPEQQRWGLMHRAELPADTGMLFIYNPPRRIAMWMKNTLIPLDMLFAGSNGTVFYIHENAQPLSEELIVAPAEVAYVLELPAGAVKSLGVRVGDRLVL